MTNHPNRSKSIRLHVEFGRPTLANHHDAVVAGGYALARAFLTALSERGLTGPMYAVARDNTLGSSFAGQLTLVCGDEVADIEYGYTSSSEHDDVAHGSGYGFSAELRKSDWQPLSASRAATLKGVLSPIDLGTRHAPNS